MPRRLRLISTSLAGLAATFGLSAATAVAAPASLTEAQAQKVGTDAYVYGVALMEFMRQTELDTSVTVPNEWGNAPVNQVGNQRIRRRDRSEFTFVDQHDVGIVSAVDKMDGRGGDAGQGLVYVDRLGVCGCQLIHS